ncbi:MAG: 30S ribosomal protein S9 [Candidatus Parcubacteria bacterium]|nr:MAG: 30S ribosomal protein S9 [Candidatus Parcubacteria bacterium]
MAKTSRQTASYIEAVGRRKTAVARVRLTASKQTSVHINGKPLAEYFPLELWQKAVLAPLETIKEHHPQSYTITIKVVGGGLSSQAQAARHGVARAVEKMEPSLRSPLKIAGFLKRDPRAKERRKFGLKKARKAPQWSKR